MDSQNKTQQNPTRRTALKFLGAGALSLASSTAFAMQTAKLASSKPEKSKASRTDQLYAKSERTISLFNTHTRETITVTFYANGKYDENALNKLNLFLRDHRENEAMVMDRMLFTQLWAISKAVGTEEPFHIISGYRSPKTNEYLRKKSTGVAKFSLHMLGQAIDFRVPGVSTRKLRDTAQLLEAGGVGYYAGSDFVHIDTGEIRHWG